MVLSLGHIHRSELPPTTASVITGCRGDPGTGGASLVTPVLPRRALTQHVQGEGSHFAPPPVLSDSSDAHEGTPVLPARL